MNKKVLITGGAGFIAHHMIDYLLNNTDWNIITLDRLDYSGNLNRLHEILIKHEPINQKRVKTIFHDLKAEINPLVRSFLGNPDIILHLAAASHVDRSITHPTEVINDNVIGTVNLLEYARTLDNLERFLYFSTDEIFGPALGSIKFKEYDRYNSTNPYSASKAAAEELCVAYKNTYKVPIACSHTMNVFGERQTPEKYIPLCIKKIRDNQKIFIHSNKEKTQAGSRFYIHAADVADAIYFILSNNTIDRCLDIIQKDDVSLHCAKFNIVGAEEIDNYSLAKMIADIQNKKLNYEFVDFHASRPGHDLRYALDGKLMEMLGWVPKIKLSERIEQVTNWTLENDRWLG